MKKTVKTLKALLSITLCVIISASFITQFSAAEVDSGSVDYEQSNIENEQYNAGGFTSDDSAKVDSDYKYYFEVNSFKNANQIIDEYNLNEDDYELSDKLNGKIIVQADISKNEAEKIENSPLVNNVEKNYNVNGCAELENDEDLTQWYLDAMNVSEAPEAPENTVKIELLDSGVSYVSALSNIHNVSLIDGENCNPLFTDYNGHGTALAGIIAGSGEDFKGVNPNAELYDVQVLDNNLQAPVSKIVEGIYWGIDNGVDIINMSFGTAYDSEILHSAVAAAYDAGILMVAAVGNDSEAGVMYPAAYPEVIAVGSTDSNGDYVSEYAGQNSAELAAPGTQIISTGILDGFSTGCGTSLSTAEVTGIASRLMEKDGANADFVRYLLKATGRAVDNSSAKLVDLGCALENFDTDLLAYTANPTAPIVYVNNSAPEAYDVGEIVTGLWLSDDHENLAKAAVLYRDSLVNDNSNLLSKIENDNKNALIYAARESDAFKTYYKEHFDGNEYIGGLHGFENYYLVLRALWKCANYTQRKEKDPYKAALDSFDSNDYSADTKKYIKGVLECVKVFIEYTKTNKFGSVNNSSEDVSKYCKTAVLRKYLITGLAIHMISDVYSHRSKVPVCVAENTKNNIETGNKEKIDIEHLKNVETFYVHVTEGIPKKDDDGNIIKDENGRIIREKKLTFEVLKNYLKDGVIIDGKQRTAQYLNNHEYTDKRSFCEERFDEAKIACKKYLVEATSEGNSATKDKLMNIIKQNTDNYVNLIHIDTYLQRLK